ncbi:hypothetical protein [Corynebacterium jeikeium]|uniref:hypothetical protein n=1 Tax=Corynebacterium jeikeium TaxID=38289 RepID=UPI0008882E7F|nr:hypothetical protein [Corynebacterium jeikeium]SCX06766.1 hypothetical protein CJBVI_0509 [Corynebacterium jeikeium]
MSLTTPDDVRARWLSSAPLPDDTAIEAWIEDAETHILAEIPTLADQLTDDPDGQWRKRMVYVTVQLVMQALKNPDGVRQQSQTSGVFTNAVTYGTETITSGFTLSPVHRAMLTTGTKKNFGFDMTESRSTSHSLEYAWVNGPDHLAPTERW